MDPLQQSQPITQPGQAPAYPEQTPVSTSDISPVPESPVSPGDVSQGLSQEEMRANLEDLMLKIQARYEDFSNQKDVSDNVIKEQQDLALREIFDLFTSMGIDPNDPEKVRIFLDEIKQTDPELYQQVEKSLQILLGGDVTQGAEENPSENMNINTNEEIPQNL